MSIQEQTPREFSRPKEALNNHYQVVIVGGGLSGITLARHLSKRGIDYLLVDSESGDRSQNVHYLTTRVAAESLGLQEEYNRQINSRVPITGYSRFDGGAADLQTLESLVPDANRPGGFITLSKQDIKNRARVDGIRLASKMSLAEAHKNDTDIWDLKFQNGQSTSAAILVDATGARARVAKLTGLIDDEIFNKRKIRYCYGANVQYNGPEDTLIFADRFPKQIDLGAQEGAGWIMPLGNGKAEIVVGWEGEMKDAGAWYRGQPLKLLQRYVDWFNERGIAIDASTRSEVISGVFSQQPLDYRKLKHDSNLLLFGEALGLNNPLNGYLISGIDGYAKIISEAIIKRLNGSRENPYEKIFAHSKTFFGPQMALSKRKTEGAISGVGRAAATAKLQEFLIANLSPDGLWDAIDKGVSIRNLLAGLITNPKYIPVVLSLGFDYISLLFSDDLFQKELWLKFKKGMKENRILSRRRESGISEF